MGQVRQRRREYDAETVELTYQVWSTSGGCNMPETLVQMERQYGITIPMQTAYGWKQVDQWEQRFAIEQRVSTQDVAELHSEQLQVAGLKALAYLSSVVTGDNAPDKGRIEAAKHLEAAARRERSTSPSRTRRILRTQLTMSATELRAQEEANRAARAIPAKVG